MIRLRNAFDSAKTNIQKKRNHLIETAVSNLSGVRGLNTSFPEVERLWNTRNLYTECHSTSRQSTHSLFQKRNVVTLVRFDAIPVYVVCVMNVNYREAQIKYRKQSIGDLRATHLLCANRNSWTRAVQTRYFEDKPQFALCARR